MTRSRILVALFVPLALLFTGAGCVSSPLAALKTAANAAQDRCATEAAKIEANDQASDPGMVPLYLETHYDTKLHACLFSDEYRGKSKKFPAASWVVRKFVANADTGATLKEYVSVDGKTQGSTSFDDVNQFRNAVFNE